MEANLLEEKRAVEGMMGRVQRLWLALVSQPRASDTNELGELGEFGSVFGKVAAEPHTVFSVCAGAVSSACGHNTQMQEGTVVNWRRENRIEIVRVAPRTK